MDQERLVIRNDIPDQSQSAALLAFARSQPILMPQLLPAWAQAFAASPGYDYRILTAWRDGHPVGYLPFVRIIGPCGAFVQSTALLAYGGPVTGEPQVAQRLIEMLVEWSRAESALSLTVGTPPFADELQLRTIADAFEPDHRTENFYQFSLLDAHPLARLTKKRRSAFRSEIARASTSGLTLDDHPTHDDLEAWLAVYEERFREIGARPYPRAFLEAIHQHLIPAGHATMIVARDHGQVIGGTIFLLGVRAADYFATAYRTEWMDRYPATWVLSEMFDRLIAAGYTHFNWESSPGRGGVYKYKERWGAAEGRHCYYTKILGDITPFLARPKEEITKNHPGCFVLPFSLWTPRDPQPDSAVNQETSA